MNCPKCHKHVTRLQAMTGKPHCPHCNGACRAKIRHKRILLAILVPAIILAALAPIAPNRVALILLILSSSVIAAIGFYALIDLELQMEETSRSDGS